MSSVWWHYRGHGAFDVDGEGNKDDDSSGVGSAAAADERGDFEDKDKGSKEKREMNIKWFTP